MRFMMLMIPEGYAAAAPDTKPSAEAIETMMKYNDDLKKAGVLLSLEGLHPAATGARISFKGGQPTVTDGPFADMKEALGGYWMLDLNSREEAIEWARRCPAAEGDIIEIRQVFEIDEFPEDIQRAVRTFDG
ncbi:MAG: YciI family protein [Neorhizobium sp.]|nr:YciI family protein [Neorhizobium sp.]